MFTRTKLAASRLASWLDRHGVAATAIHSDRAQADRTKALEAFKAGEIRVLVATDVAARGLDIEDLPHVVNFELPWNPEDYVHRIGRTGRAGATGDAISLVCIDEADLLRGVQRLLQRAIPWEVADGLRAAPRRRGAAAAVAARRQRLLVGSGGARRGGGSSSAARSSRRRSGGRLTRSRASARPRAVSEARSLSSEAASTRRVDHALVGEHRDRDAVGRQVADDVPVAQVPPRVAEGRPAADGHDLDPEAVRDARVERRGCS